MKTIKNWIDNRLVPSADGMLINKYNPHTGEIAAHVTASKEADVRAAVEAAKKAFYNWSYLTSVSRGQKLMSIVDQMKHLKTELASCISQETGKPLKDAIGEVNGAIMQGEYFAGEGMRLHGRTLGSSMYGKQSFLIRQAIGVAGLIVPANTPIANIAWKAFPALICGNTVVLKASEDAPETAIFFAEICKKAGISDGVFNVIQGTGIDAGAAVVRHPEVKVLSFTGSTEVGRWIAETAGKRLARVSLELGGKNPFVVSDNVNLDQAVYWASLSAFSNAGQRCAAGSRIIVFENIYDEFVNKIIAYTKKLQLGIHDTADLGPLITKKQQLRIDKLVSEAAVRGARILCGGYMPNDLALKGFYYAPTLIDNINPEDEICYSELFGPVATIHKVKNLEEAISFANNSNYGLTAAIHTNNIDQAMFFAHQIKAGVVNINIGTFGSEPHIPFGGFGDSGNGTREPGVEALEVYSELKAISYLVRI